MYWIYFIFFITLMFTPIFFHGSVDGLEHGIRDNLEVWIIFVLGSLGLIFLSWKEQQVKKNKKIRLKLQKETNVIFNNLNDAYTYIGEANRKIEIFKNIALKASDKSKDSEQATYHYFTEALKLISKAKRVSIRFVDVESSKTLKELKNIKNSSFNIKNSNVISDRRRRNIEKDNCLVIRSPYDIKKLTAIAIVQKVRPSYKLDDPDAIRAIISHALCFFVYSKYKDKL